MSSITMYVTAAGAAELVNNAAMSLGPAQISTVKVGSGVVSLTPDANGLVAVTDLTTPTKTFSAVSGNVLDANRIHITIRDTTTDAYDVHEIGVFLSTGTLFAYGSWSDAPITKGAAILLLSFDLVVSGYALDSLTIDDLGFSNPPASESVAGVAKLATQAQVNAGTDDTTIVTPDTLAGYAQFLQASESVQGTAKVATDGQVDAGTDDTTIITPKKFKTRVRKIVPPGLVLPFAGLVIPGLLLPTDGSPYSRSTYPDLFGVLVRSAVFTVNISSPSAATFTWAAHGLRVGYPVKFKTTGSLPTGLLPATAYYVVSTTTNTFQISATPGGTALITSGSQSGIHTAICAPFGDGDGSTTFNVPEIRGDAIRMLDAGRGIDLNRVFGSHQDDALQNITGSFSSITGGTSAATGAFQANGSNVGHINTSLSGLDASVTFDASRVARTSTETRMRNTALWCVITT